MKELKPSKAVHGTIEVPSDKSIGHRAVLFSLLSEGPITIRNFPSAEDCQTTLNAVQELGVSLEKSGNEFILTRPESFSLTDEKAIDCGNSGTTVRLLAGILAGSPVEVILTGDESLSSRPMKRIIDPLSEMGAELFSDEGHLPLRIRGKKLLPIEYMMPIASAQVKSSLLLAGLASRCSITVRESVLTRNHTELMIQHLGEGMTVRIVKPIQVQDPDDPRKKKMVMPEKFKKEIVLTSQTKIHGGSVDVPGDISTASFFFAAAAITGGTVTVKKVGLNPTRTAFLDILKLIGVTVKIENKETVTGEVRGDVTVSSEKKLKARKISGEMTASLIDEIPILAVMGAFSDGTTIIRDASELKVKESDRLTAIAENLRLMGVKVGLLDDGLAIEGKTELEGADFVSYGDHRIAMAFSIASLACAGPSTLDDESVVGISCPEFYELLNGIRQEG